MSRSFTITSVKKHGQKGRPLTKGVGGRYKSETPRGAASKMHSFLCRTKRIKGTCAFTLMLKETTQGSAHKTYTYKAWRKKLAKPAVIKTKSGGEIKFKYKNKLKSM